MLKEMAMIKCKPLNIKDGNKGKIIELPVQITLDWILFAAHLL